MAQQQKLPLIAQVESTACRFLSDTADDQSEQVTNALVEGKADSFQTIRPELPEEPRERAILLTRLLAEELDDLVGCYPANSPEQMALLLGGLVLVQKEILDSQSEGTTEGGAQTMERETFG